jgi:hypothetical protein
MLIELWVGNYPTFDGFMNGHNWIFKASIIHNDKTMIWIFKIRTLIRE